MIVEKSIDKIKSSVAEYCRTEVYILNNTPEDIVNAILVAIELPESAEKGSVILSREDKAWFQGAYHVSRNLDNADWEDIGILYSEIADYANKKYFGYCKRC